MRDSSDRETTKTTCTIREGVWTRKREREWGRSRQVRERTKTARAEVVKIKCTEKAPREGTGGTNFTMGRDRVQIVSVSNR